MSGPTKDLQVLRARLGNAARSKNAEAEQAVRQELNEAKAARAIRESLNAQGGLTADARFRLTQLLLGGDK